MNPDPGGLTVEIADRSVTIVTTGGGRALLPVGPVALFERELERADRPAPEQLTNALGTVADHFEDVIIASPSVAATPSVHATGPHAVMLARVELGAERVPSGYRLERPDAEEVFRTLVAEPVALRRENPGLDPEHVNTIIPTCCTVLAIMRRLDLAGMVVDPSADPVG